MSEDIIRVIRIVEYVGPRSLVERNVGGSLHGTRDNGNGVKITAVTLGEYPEIMKLGAAASAAEEENKNVRSRE
jgi:hypothetical protein